MLTRPRILLQMEGAALFIAATVLFYGTLHGSWMLYVLLLLVPDISMIGFLAGNRIGAAIYNLGHTTVLPLALGVWAYLSKEYFLAQVALIWLTHIGLDRMIGYGLKYPTAFKDTHLQKL